MLQPTEPPARADGAVCFCPFRGGTGTALLSLGSQKCPVRLEAAPNKDGTVVCQDLLKMAKLSTELGHCSRGTAEQNVYFLTYTSRVAKEFDFLPV